MFILNQGWFYWVIMFHIDLSERKRVRLLWCEKLEWLVWMSQRQGEAARVSSKKEWSGVSPLYFQHSLLVFDFQSQLSYSGSSLVCLAVSTVSVTSSDHLFWLQWWWIVPGKPMWSESFRVFVGDWVRMFVAASVSTWLFFVSGISWSFPANQRTCISLYL